MTWQPVGQRLLVIDDDPLYQSLISRLLADADDEAVTDVAPTLGSAHEMLYLHHYDAVLVDVTLPDGSGLDLAADLSQEQLAPPVIVITGSDGREVWADAAAAGATTVLPKSLLSAERLAGTLEFSYEVTASERIATLTASIATDTTGTVEPSVIDEVIDRLVGHLNLDRASIRIIDPDGSVVATAGSTSGGRPEHVIARTLDGWSAVLTIEASDRRWGRVDAALGNLCDVVLSRTLLEASYQQLDLSEHRYRAVADASADLIMTVDEADTVVAANLALRAELGIDPLHTTLPNLALTNPVMALAARLLTSARQSGEPAHLDDRPIDNGGTRRWYSGRAIPAGGVPDDEAMHLVITETTGRVVTEHELSTLALTDPLTGLANRRLALDRLQHALDQVGRRTGLVVVAQLDIDHFKSINDLYGHAAGDAALCAIGRRLNALVRGADTAARLGGDEFLIIAEGVPDADTAGKLIARLHHDLGGQVAFADRNFEISVSLGYVTVHERSMEADEVLRRADAALYRSKSDGRNRFTEFEDHDHIFGSVAEISRELRHGIDEERFRLRYQPIVNGDRIVGLEALVRLHHPVHGEISPHEFIGVLIESPMLVPIGEWIITTAINRLAAWTAEGISDDQLRMHVNVVPQQLADATFIDHVLTELARAGVDPHRLVIEITEQSLLDLSRRSSGLKRLAEGGVGLYLDDFGTGASSITHLRSAVLQGLKIDRSFISGALAERRDADIVDGLISLGRSLGLDVIVEGIEHLDQLERFAPADVSVQGFVYSVPLDDDEIQTLLVDSSSSRLVARTHEPGG
ncbi:MAG: EAL domain-containing protein [Actinomycetota bacterium]